MPFHAVLTRLSLRFSRSLSEGDRCGTAPEEGPARTGAADVSVRSRATGRTSTGTSGRRTTKPVAGKTARDQRRPVGTTRRKRTVGIKCPQAPGSPLDSGAALSLGHPEGGANDEPHIDAGVGGTRRRAARGTAARAPDAPHDGRPHGHAGDDGADDAGDAVHPAAPAGAQGCTGTHHRPGGPAHHAAQCDPGSAGRLHG